MAIEFLPPFDNEEEAVSSPPAKARTFGPRQKRAIDNARQRQSERLSPFSVLVVNADDPDNPERYGIAFDPDPSAEYFARYREAFGTASPHFSRRQVGILIDFATPHGGAPIGDLVNAGIAFVSAQNPRSEVEAALALQIFVTHEMSLQMLTQIGAAETIERQERLLNMVTKLQRTMFAGTGTLKRFSSTGEQTTRVQHQNVVVQDGGQAIVGDVVRDGGSQR